MGYTTDFSGSFNVNPPIEEPLLGYLNRFAQSRRMARDVSKLPPVSEEHWCPIPTWGEQGEYYVYGSGSFGQGMDPDIVDFNSPPGSQPGLRCQWVPDEDGQTIAWDGGEKFYDYVEWLKYIIDRFLEPAGHVLNGEVQWRGEEFDDIGLIVVENNKVTRLKGVMPHKSPGDTQGPGSRSKQDNTVIDIADGTQATVSATKGGYSIQILAHSEEGKKRLDELADLTINWLRSKVK